MVFCLFISKKKNYIHSIHDYSQFHVPKKVHLSTIQVIYNIITCQIYNLFIFDQSS